MESRLKKSMRNSVFGIIGLLSSLIVSFATKSVFIKLLGAEYNGVNGLYTNILLVLSLAELGFASSIAYALYKPLKEKDEVATAALMNYFAKIYRIIAVVVACVGACCIPFLQYLIAEDLSTLPFTLNQLRIYFALFLTNTVLSYLLAYKRTIVTADQNNYIVSAVDYSCNIALNLLQIVLLLITHNYYAYLGIMIAKTVLNNLIIHIIATKKYPYLNKYKKVHLELAQKKLIIKNVKAMFLHKIGAVAINSTTTIIISAFVGVVDAGIYGNYLMLVTQVNSFVVMIFTAVTASVGNLCVNESKDLQYAVFKRIQYLSDFFAVFCFVCFVCLFNPFIKIWIGEEMLFSMPIVIVISLNVFVSFIRKAVLTFRDAMGLFVMDWYKPIIEAVVGIALAIGLSYVWGTFGILVGNIFPMICSSMIIENYVLFKYGLQKSLKRQIMELLLTTCFTAALTIAIYFLLSLMPGGIGWFVLKLILCVVLSAGAFFLATCWMPEFKYYKNLGIGILKKVVGKIKKKTVTENECVQNKENIEEILKENETDNDEEGEK